MPTEPLARFWLMWLIFLDLFLFALALVLMLMLGNGVLRQVNPVFLLSGDTTLIERSNHLKWLAVIVLMLAVYWRTRILVFLGLAVLYAMILIDDAGQMHERWAHAVSYQLPMLQDLGISKGQLGELAVWMLLGLALLPMLLWCALRTPRHIWAQLVPIGVAFVGLLFAAIFVDLAHDIMSARYRAAGQDEPQIVWLGMVVLENLGEAFFASLTVAASIELALRHKALPARSRTTPVQP